MNDIFDGIPIFVTVIETGGFSPAARRLGVSRSAVGKAIARLEGRLGVRLFHRTTRSQNLTDDGQSYYEHCQRALSALQTGQSLLESGHKTVVGKLRVSVPVLFGRLCIAPVLRDFLALHPKLEIDLNFSDRVVDLIEDGFDLVVRNGPLQNAAGLMARRIAHERTTVFAAPAYLVRNGAPQSPDEIGRHQAIVYCRNGRIQTWRFPQDDGPPTEIMPTARLRFDDLGAIADAATAGFGLAWLPHWLVRDQVRSRELVPVLTTTRPLASDVHLVWPETPYLPTRVRRAIDALASAGPNLSGD